MLRVLVSSQLWFLSSESTGDRLSLILCVTRWSNRSCEVQELVATTMAATIVRVIHLKHLIIILLIYINNNVGKITKIIAYSHHIFVPFTEFNKKNDTTYRYFN